MKARLICGLCERTTHVSNVKGPDIVIVCKPCATELRRELDEHCECFRMAESKPLPYLPRRAA